MRLLLSGLYKHQTWRR